MRHARLDYSGTQPWPTKREHLVRNTATGQIVGIVSDAMPDGYEPVIPDDEPVFLFRSKDPLASVVVDFYADQLIHVGAEKEMVDAVIRWAGEMRAYRDEHYPDRRVPDVDKGWLRHA